MPEKSPESADPYIGREIAGFRIEEKLGEGGMGAVYLATQTRLDRPVAFKVLPPALMRGNPQFVERFLREAKSAARLTHTNVVQVFDAGQSDDVHYIAMEYVAGVGLNDLLKKHNPFSEEESLEILIQAAKGLQAAADQGIIHRDVKPANLMVTKTGVVKVADFGLAKSADAESAITMSGQIMGTPAYMSPEQADGGAVDSRSDLYSLGVTFFEMITGRRPFVADTAIALIRKHCQDPVPDIASLRPDANPKIVSIINRMLAKNPADRYPNFGSLVSELEALEKDLASRTRDAKPEIGTSKASAPPRPVVDGDALTINQPAPPGSYTPTLAGLTMLISDEMASKEKARRRIRELVRVYEVAPPTPAGLHTPTRVRDSEATPMTIPGRVAAGFGKAVIVGILVPVILLAAVGAVFIVKQMSRDNAPQPIPAPEDGKKPVPADDGKTGPDPGPEQPPVKPDPDPAKKPVEPGPKEPGPEAAEGPRPGEPLYAYDSRQFHAQDRNFAFYKSQCPAMAGLFGSPNLKHGSSVTSIAVFPEKGLIAAGCADGTVKLWSLETGKETASIASHSQAVVKVAFSRDGTTLLTAGWDGTLRLRSCPGGAEKASYKTGGWLLCADLSPDGKCIIAGLNDGNVRVFGLESREALRSVKAHSKAVNALAFCPDSRTVVSGSEDCSVKLLDASTGAELCTLGSHSGESTSLCVDRQGRFAVSGFAGGGVSVWDLKSRKEAKSLSAGKERLTSVALDLGILATASSEGAVSAFDLESGARLYSSRDHVKEVNSLAVDHASGSLLSAGHDGRIRIRDLKKGEARMQFCGHDGSVLSVVLLPGTQAFLSGGMDAKIRKWDLASGAETAVFEGHTGWVFCLDATLDGKLAASGGNDPRIRLWDLESGKEKLSFKSGKGYVSGIRFAGQGRVLVSGSDGEISMLDSESGARLFGLEGHKGAVTRIDLSRDALYAASSGQDSSVRIWSLQGRSAAGAMWGHTKSVGTVAFSPDGKSVLSGGADGSVRMFRSDGAGKPETRQAHDGQVTSVAWADGNRQFLSAGTDGAVKVWSSLAADPKAARLPWPVNQACFTPDGLRILAAANNGVIALLECAKMETEIGGK